MIYQKCTQKYTSSCSRMGGNSEKEAEKESMNLERTTDPLGGVANAIPYTHL